MNDIRYQELYGWLSALLGHSVGNVWRLGGDASLRRYFRTQYGMAVDSPPESQKNREFVAINAELARAGVRVPAVLACDFQRGFMLLEDLGSTHFFEVAVGEYQSSYYELALTLLPRIASLRTEDLPLFDRAFILNELGIFTEWMLGRALNLTLTAGEKAMLERTFSELVTVCQEQPQIAMHRDFHCRNLMVTDTDLAVIDYQDMVTGPLTYDLASLLYDCYVVLDPRLRDSLMHKAYAAYVSAGIGASLGFSDFERYTRLTALQRHIKVLGIFCRLSLRDNKQGYLQYLSQVLGYVLEACERYAAFRPLGDFLKTKVQGRLPC